MKIILLLSLILIIVIAIIINNRNTSTIQNVSPNMITQSPIPTPTSSLITKNDKERVIIIKILNKDKSTELKIDTEFLTQLFDNLINLIQRLVKKLMSENNKKLSKEEINDLIPKFIASSVENLLKMILITIFEQEEIKDLDILKTKLLSIVQNNFITDFLLKNNDVENSTKIIESSTQLLNNEINNNFNKMGISSINDVKTMIPNLLSNIIFDMSKGIISSIIVFDENGNIIKSDKLSNIRNEFINVLNKYLPYKQVYFETSNNGSNNLPGITLKLDQLNKNEKAESIIPHELDIFNKSSNQNNIYQNINLNVDNENKSFNIQQMKNNNMNLPFMQSNQLNDTMITTNLEQINLPLINMPMNDMSMTPLPMPPMPSMSMNDMSMNPRSMPSMSMNDMSMNDMSMTPMPSMSMNDMSMNPRSMPSMSMNDMSMNDMSMTPMPMNDMSMTPMPMNDMSMTPMPMNDMSMQPLPMIRPQMTQPPMTQPPMTQQPMNDMSMQNMKDKAIRKTEIIQPIKIIPVETPNEITPIPFDMAQLTSKPIDYQQMTPRQLNNGNSFISEQTTRGPSTINRGIVDRKPKLGKNICKQ